MIKRKNNKTNESVEKSIKECFPENRPMKSFKRFNYEHEVISCFSSYQLEEKDKMLVENFTVVFRYLFDKNN